MSAIDVVDYRPEHREAFLRLNVAWLEEHGLLEPADLEMLGDPEDHILADGGRIFVGLRQGEVVGTCAAIRLSAERVELAKLCVVPSARGAGLARRLCEAVVDFARREGVAEIILTSHHDLAPAIRLYESMGFVHQPMPAEVRYASADVFMRLPLRADTLRP